MKKYMTGLIVLAFVLGNAASSLLQAQNSSEERLIKIETIQGNMVVRLHNETPGHRDNMIKLIEAGFYNNQLFHRVIKDFMIQGGDPQSAGAPREQRLGKGGPGYTIPAEFNPELFHKKGALSAARMGDQMNPRKESSGSQFYLVHGRVYTPEQINSFAQGRQVTFTEESIKAYTTIGGTPHLDGSYTVFGEIVEGMDVLDRIAATQTDPNDRPLEDVVYFISIIR